MSGEKTDWLSSSVSGRRVKQIKFDIDTDSYTDLLNTFIRSNKPDKLDTDIGFTSLEMSSSKTPSSRPINIVFDKRTGDKVAIHDGHELYEIGFANNGGLRHFENAYFTEFGYREMFGGLLGARISREVFRNSVMDIMSNPGDCAKWVHSAGVLALMIGEAGRILSVLTVVKKVMCLNLPLILDREHEWLAKLPLEMRSLGKGVPEAAAVPPVAGVPPVPAVNPPVQAPQATQPAAAPTSGPNANPLNLFP